MTIDQTGASLIYVPYTVMEVQVACILAICLDGMKSALLIITKSKKEKIKYVSGMFLNPKKYDVCKLL